MLVISRKIAIIDNEIAMDQMLLTSCQLLITTQWDTLAIFFYFPLITAAHFVVSAAAS